MATGPQTNSQTDGGTPAPTPSDAQPPDDPEAGSPPPASGGDTPPPSDSPGGSPSDTGDGESTDSRKDGGGTLADGGGDTDADDQAQQTPAQFPTNWREILAGGDQKFLQRLNRFSSPNNFAKSWLAAQQKIGAGEVVTPKPEDGDEEALNEWRAAHDIPAEPEGYLEKLPDGLVIGEQDKPIADSFVKAMHEVDAPPSLVHKGLEWYYQHAEQVEAERAEQDRQFRAQAEDDLRAEFGPEFRPNLNNMKSLVQNYFSEDGIEKLFGARTPDGNPLGDDPDVIRGLVALAREVNPHGTVTPAEGKTAMQTIQQEKAELQKEMADTKSDYWKNEAKQARWRELDEMEQRYKQREQG